MKILFIVGARPNFMKVAPLIAEVKKHTDIEYKLIHTGQHFDKNMSDTFFEDLGLPYPDINLNIHGGTVSTQIGRIMIEFDAVVQQESPDYVLVVGDVNSTVACAIVAKQNGIKVIHVESGLRSFDQNMPEEINRILTDKISDLLFVTEESGMQNLKNEGITSGAFLLGNVMIDSLYTNIEKISQANAYSTFGLEKNGYCSITLHRPSNVDTKENLEEYLRYFNEIAEYIPLFLTLHPRTNHNIEKFELGHYLQNPRITTAGPMGYIDFINIVMNSAFILTDSGGVQEESTYLKVPCLTMRKNTERPITCDVGSNTLLGDDFEQITAHIKSILAGTYKQGQIPSMWDGKAAERIVEVILRDFHSTGK